MTNNLFVQFVRAFADYVKEKNITLPVILYVDGHSTHISLEAAEFCADNQIILYCLLENASHVLQACDVGLFSPLKTSRQKKVKDWHIENMD